MSTTILYGDQKLAVNTETIAAARTLTASDSGTVFTLSAAAGAAVTLPALTDGFRCRIIIGSAFATTAWTVVAPTGKLRGGAIVNSTFVASAGTTTATFSASAETIGDFIDLVCDGTNYYVSGVGASASSIAFS